MKKNKKIVLIVIAIVAIVMAFLGGGAYAKYMSKVSGNGVAEVANWSFKVNESSEQIQSISLKSTANNSKLLDNKIAPGTEGNFQVKLDATGSEVAVKYAVKFEEKSPKPTNLKFTYNGKEYSSLKFLQEELEDTIDATAENKIRIINIGWNWKYETGSNEQEVSKNDKIDTNEAKQLRDYNFDIIVSGIQIDSQV